ncbi:MAG: type II secretion system minor pseudopilin GspK [Gallionella sp.]|jgi:general secretion pathway protein K|nr:type II secretion system minor pseudopilin GspK [Gallionella sp.]
MKPVQEKGAAIIMVMLIVALATLLATYIARQQSLWQRQIESHFDRTQARQFGIAGIDWARAILADDARVSTTDHAGEMWAAKLPALPVDDGEVSGLIEDQQGRFNLNRLVRNGVVSTKDLATFQHLLGLLGLPVDLANAVTDWIDSDSEVRYAGGAEDIFYLSLPQPYRTANRPLAEIGELILVRGFNEKIIARLKPYISVLPVVAPINVNFAPPEVLAAMLPDLSLSDARQLAYQRRGKPFKDLDDFKNRLPRGLNQVLPEDFGVESQFFMVTGRAKIGTAQMTTQALLQRAGVWPMVIWQTLR